MDHKGLYSMQGEKMVDEVFKERLERDYVCKNCGQSKTAHMPDERCLFSPGTFFLLDHKRSKPEF